MFPQNVGSKEFGHEKGTKSAEGAVAGGGTGAIVGGALGWLASIGLLVIPGVGPFVAAGPIVAALAGIGAGGAIGGTTGALIGLGIPEYQAKRYEGRMRKGGILLSVHADDQEWIRKGRQILEQTGAEHISQTGETKGDFGNSDRPTSQSNTSRSRSNTSRSRSNTSRTNRPRTSLSCRDWGNPCPC